MILDLAPLKDTARSTYAALGAAYRDEGWPRGLRLEAWVLQKAIYGLVRRLEDFEKMLKKKEETV
jgi:hypothetical protein